MNFKKLQAMQAKLDEAILADKAPMTAEERFNKTLVALSVEIAEVANTVEHFKFWKDNKGKVDKKRFIESRSILTGEKDGLLYDSYLYVYVTQNEAHKLTLIEECSDALHFILSLANQMEYEINGFNFIEAEYTKEEMYLATQASVCLLLVASGKDKFVEFELLVNYFFDYVTELGITDEELEQAYYDKNKVNYERLENGY